MIFDIVIQSIDKNKKLTSLNNKYKKNNKI